jgi:hypothetical protein
MKARIAAALVATLVALAACSSSGDAPGASGDGSRLGGASGPKGDGDRGPGKKGLRANGAGESGGGDGSEPGEDGTDGDGGTGAQPTPQAGSHFASNGPPSPVDPSLARESVFHEEAQPDGTKEGLPPSYAEIVAASIEGLGKDVRFTLSFDGKVPEKLDGEETFMVISWSLSAGEDETYAFSARGSKDGWEVYAGAKNQATELPGTFEIEGNSIVVQVPWSFLDGPRAFRWYTSSSWFSNVAGTTHYLFDPCPNEQAGTFPD